MPDRLHGHEFNLVLETRGHSSTPAGLTQGRNFQIKSVQSRRQAASARTAIPVRRPMIYRFVCGLIGLGAFINGLQCSVQFAQLRLDPIGLSRDPSQFTVELVLGVLQEAQRFLELKQPSFQASNVFRQLF